MIENFIDRAEVDGQFVSKNYYTALQDNVHQQANALREEIARLIAERDKQVNDGLFKVGDEQWDEYNKEINDLTVSVHELGTQWAEYQKAIRETEWDIFDTIQDRITNIADEAQFLIDLMSNKKLFEDNGQLTDEGWATMGLYGEQYNILMNQADRYAEEIKKLEDQMKNDPYLNGDGAFNQDVIDRYYELIEAQQEAILSAEDMKNAIKDMVEEGIDLELEHLDDLIDKYLDALQAQKDLYDYEQNIRERTEDIASLEKQLSAYAGDTSEESKAMIQQLTEELTDAQQELANAEYERQISDIERILDQVRLDYETVLMSRLDNIDALIMDMITEINANSGMIGETINSAAADVGYQLTEETQAIWDTSKGTQDVLAMYGDKFLNNGTTIANTLNTVNNNIQTMISKLDAIANQKIQSAQESNATKIPVTKPTPTPPANNNNNNNQQSSSGGDGVAKVGDRVKFVSGQYYLDSYGTAPVGAYKRGQYVYITAINSKGSKPYHISTGSKIGNGDLGWLTLAQLEGYAKGKKLIDNDKYAWTQEDGAEMIVRPSDGAILTPLAKNDSVLTADASNNIWKMANNPSDFIKDNLGVNSPATPATNGGNTTYNQDIQNVTFSLPNVKNYEELLVSMQKDRNFERLISSMTLDKLAGKSNLTKSKALR